MFKSKKIFGLLSILALGICLSILAFNFNGNSKIAKAEINSAHDENEQFQKENLDTHSSEQVDIPFEELKLDESEFLDISENSVFEEEDIDHGISTIADKSTYVQGTLQWIDDKGNYHPLREIMVNIFDNQPIGENILGTVYTDNSGNFSFTFQNKDGFWDFENGGYDIFIRFYAGDSNIMVHNPNGDEYYYQSGETGNIATGSTKYCNYSIDMSSDIGQALQISQAVITARDYAKEMMGRLPSAVDVFYPLEDNCHYLKDSKQIHITGSYKNNFSPILKPYASWDPIMHEYGHHIQHELGITAGLGGTHFTIDMVEHFYKEYKDNQLCQTCLDSGRTILPLKDCKDYGIKLAWGEAWPTVFGLLAQDYFINLLQDINTVGDTEYTSYNSLRFDAENNSEISEGNEEAIIKFLWDLFDDGDQSTSLDDDKFNLRHRQMWDLVVSSKATTFSEFINYIYNNTSLDKSDLGILLLRMNLTAHDLYFYNSLDFLPALEWKTGGSLNYKQNKFVVTFYDGNKSEIFKTGEIIGKSKYNLSEFEWNTILNRTTNYFYCSVSSYQDDGYGCITGPYISEYKKINVTDLATQVNVEEPISGWGSSNNYNWFKFIAPSSGIYSFYTEGTTDTYGELFSKLIYGSGIENRLTYDDNSGTDGNFEIKYSLHYNDIVFIRVKMPDSNSPYRLVVHFEEHVHNFKYKYIDRTNHCCECDSCDYIYYEEHSYEIVGNEVRCKCRSFGTSVPGGGIKSVGDTANIYINQFLRITDKKFNFTYCKSIKYYI